MKNLIKSVFQIWMQPVYQYINNKDYKTIYFLFFILPVTCLVISYLINGENLKFMGIALLIGLAAASAVVFMLWILLMTTLIRSQFSPENVQLVPYYRRNVKVAVAIPTLILASLFAFLASIKADHSIGFAWIISIVALLGFVSKIRATGGEFIFPAFMIIFSTSSFNNFTPVFAKVVETIDHLWLTIPLGLLLLHVGLGWIFEIDKDRLFERKKSFDRLKKQAENAADSNDQGYFRKFNLYDYSFKKAISFPSNAKVLLPFLFGPNIHWSQQISGTLLLSAFVFAYMALLGLGNYILTALMFCLYLVFIGYVINLGMALYGRKQEQGLVLLTPLVNSNKEMTRLTLQYFLRNSCCAWLANLVLITLVCHYANVQLALSKLAYLCCFGFLPIITCLVKNHSKKATWQESGILVSGLISCAFIVVSLLLSLKFELFNIAIPCALMLVSQAMMTRHYWRQRLQQTAFFPVGRGV